MRKTSVRVVDVWVRFHVERRVVSGPAALDVWVRETIAGAKTIAGARRDRRNVRRESPSYFKRDDWRIVKLTTTTEVVT